jgi:hypothetical protein
MIDALKALAENWREIAARKQSKLERLDDSAQNVPLAVTLAVKVKAFTRCAADLDKVIAQAPGSISRESLADGKNFGPDKNMERFVSTCEIADFIREEWGADGTFTMRNDLLRKLAARLGIAVTQ